MNPACNAFLSFEMPPWGTPAKVLREGSADSTPLVEADFLELGVVPGLDDLQVLVAKQRVVEALTDRHRRHPGT
jgi:hypothetical protein